MKHSVYRPGKIHSLASYLGHFFLRFPGRLEPETAVSWEVFDTYDRAWSLEGQVWVKDSTDFVLIDLPSLAPAEVQPESPFTLHAAQSLGRVVVRSRCIMFEGPENSSVRGRVFRIRGGWFLSLEGSAGPQWSAITAALEAEGLLLWSETATLEVLLKDRRPFEPPRVFHTPAPEQDGGLALIERIKDGLRLCSQYEKGVRDDVDTECLHQYRVYLRRVRSLVSLGLVWKLQPEWRRLRNVLKALQQETNELRDLDVLVLGFPELKALMPWDEGRTLEGWELQLKRRRLAEQRRVKAWMASEAYRYSLREVDNLLIDLSGLGDPMPIPVLAAQALSRASKQLRSSLRSLGDAPADEALHEVRIRSKQLRYALDALGSFAPPATVKRLVSELKKRQEGLGQFQDRSVLLDRLQAERSRFRSGRPQADPVAFGILVGLLTADHARQKLLALDDARALSSKAFLKTLAQLSAPEAPPHEH